MSVELPPKATHEAFYDWCYSVGICSGMYADDDIVARSEAMMNAWWRNRHSEELAYGPVAWRVPNVVLSLTHVEILGQPERSGIYGYVDLQFPALQDPVKIDITSRKSDTVDGTATEEED